ncbi:putative TIM-barrel fold metal-dependent hydrolase [Paraburkholderia sp. BL27I4N3]|uniref:amidohydrolase family protein n=1 Tax=Paraburkholderia sp. BL27I4N3 TaxID=1938805 RepID=UPI000E243298|nr:amidohydrolase family protein [Paraburkholderia sp. BL27I4N3]REE07446.1 putative TIM-barrel fold metal-dependent hydrolase [Paraburkholderia sp. BL27I4N3]
MPSTNHDTLVECPTPPRRALPRRSCDTHAHVFGSRAAFPLAPDAGFEPPLAPAELHTRVLAHLGFERGVIVQGSCYGTDNACTLDAIARAPESRRGIGAALPTVTDDELARLRAGGIVGLRFTEIASARYGGRKKGAIGFDALVELGSRLRDHDMIASIDTTSETLVDWAPRLFSLGIPLVLDHIGRVPDGLSRSITDPAFMAMRDFLGEGRIWAKLTLVRGSRQAPDYEDFRPLHEFLVEANQDNLLWGTDWPLILMGERQTPDLGHLLDLLDEWTTDDVRHRILVDNPARLYGFA